nr:nucleotide disphospho-sugar-binding domain-containing protein [Streptosporangium pseudovulgare]
MPGHFNPLVPLCWALRAAGHEVVVVSNPGLVPAIVQAGLPALPAGDPGFDSYAVLREQLAARSWRPVPPADTAATGTANASGTAGGPANTTANTAGTTGGPAGAGETDGSAAARPSADGSTGANAGGSAGGSTGGDAGGSADHTRRRLHGFRVATRSALAQADDAAAFARHWRPDLVLFEPVAFVGPLIGKLCGVPAVRVLWSVDFTGPMARFEADVVGDLLDRFGLERLDVNGDLTLDPCPPELQYDLDLPRRRFRFVPYNGASVLPADLEPPTGLPRVCVTWGTSQERLGFDRMMIAPRVVEALAGLKAEVVVAVTDGQRAAFDPLPDNVLRIGRMPLDALLRDCDLLVQQGGAGGTMTALVNGVPQLVVPHMPDEIFHGRQVERGGVGRCLPGAEATVEALREQITAVLDDPSYRDTARRLREDMLALPTPAQLVPELEELARAGVRPGA